MYSEFDCPVCESSRWTTIGTRTFSVDENGPVSEYVKQRMDIFFNVWIKSGPEKAELLYKLCEGCGFVCYSPRPDENDLSTKYKVLSRHRKEDDNNDYQDRRAKELYGFLKRRGSIRNGAEVLDFGGGNGSLMRYFAGAGCHCDLVDYDQAPVEYVNKVADTLENMDSKRRYDLIVCSHVFEHLSSPRSVLAGLKSFLRQDGQIYIEVPMEVWKGPPKQEEPVTHINFFTPGSLKSLVETAGLSTGYCRWASALHLSGNNQVVVKALAGWPTGKITPYDKSRGVENARRFLNPGFTDKISREMLSPRQFARSFLRRWGKG